MEQQAQQLNHGGELKTLSPSGEERARKKAVIYFPRRVSTCKSRFSALHRTCKSGTRRQEREGEEDANLRCCLGSQEQPARRRGRNLFARCEERDSGGEREINDDNDDDGDYEMTRER